MAKTRCIIVDDEPLAIEIIESYLEKLDDFEIIATCEDAIEAMNILRNKQVDLMFLDIQMPKLTGIDFLKSLKNSPKVIFTTAYREYALEGYELDIVDYLLKPIPFDRFMKAINKFYQLASTSSDFSIISNDQDANNDNSYILVKGNRKIHKVNISDIVIIESVKDYVQIFTKEKSIIVKQQIGVLEENLPPDKFIRIHRSYIVSIQSIDSFTASTIEIGKRELPIGRNYKNSTYKALRYNG